MKKDHIMESIPEPNSGETPSGKLASEGSASIPDSIQNANLQDAIRPRPEVMRSLMVTLSGGNYAAAGSLQYDWERFVRLPDEAKRNLRSLVHGSIKVETDPTKVIAENDLIGTYTADDLKRQRQMLWALLQDAFAVCSIVGTAEIYSIGARGLYALQMESGGDVFGQIRQRELECFFAEPDISARIHSLAYRYKSYYYDDITPDKVRGFIGQLDSPHGARKMLSIQEQIRFYPKIEVTRLLRYYLNEATNNLTEDFSVVPFGNLADSTAEMSQTVLKDMFTDLENARRSCTLMEALERPGKIVFIDDNIGSGTQAKQILSEWLGLNTNDPEHIVQPLPEDRVRMLKSKALAIVCCHGYYKGLKSLEEFASAHDLNLDVYCDRVAHPDIFSADFIPTLWSNEHNCEYWKQRFQELGERLLIDNPNEGLRKRDALGWKRSHGLVVYAHNVPTTTFTFLWKGHSGHDGQWYPLFPRRG